MTVDDKTVWPDMAEITGREADELLGHLVAPLPGALGLLMLDLSRGMLVDGGSVTVIRHEPEKDFGTDEDMASVFSGDEYYRAREYYGDDEEPDVGADEPQGDFALGEGFPSRMQGIAAEDPLDCLTQLVPGQLRQG